nr:hypothetical protein [Tanacetum cinerariifolium]
MDDPNITMEEYIRHEEEKARRRGKVYNWETAIYGKIWYDEDVHDLRSVETEFPAIVLNDALTFEVYTVDTAYSSNEYSVFDTGINMTYPGKKKNDVKARTTLMLSLPNEHQLRFSKYKTAREGSETLEQTFNRLQVIVVQLQFMDVEIEHDDLNQKFLTSLAPEWLMHTIDRGRRDNYRQGSKAEEQAPKALMTIDGVGWDWSYMANDKEDHALVADEVARTEFALMANTSAESKSYMANAEEDHALVADKVAPTEFALMANTSAETLAQVESRLVEYKEREVKYITKIRTLEFYNESNKEYDETLKKKLETLKQEKEGVDGKLAGLLTASKDLDNLIESQR